MNNCFLRYVQLVVLVSILISFPEDYDLVDSKHNGSIQTITEFKYEAQVKNKQIVRKKKWEQRKFLTFDENGRKTRYEMDWKSSPMLLETYKYDSSGYLIEKYSNNKFIDGASGPFYGLPLSEHSNRYIYINDSRGNMLEATEKNKNDRIDGKTVCKYNDKDQLIDLIKYERRGDIDEQLTGFIYDSFGNWIQRTTIEDGDKETERREFKYDSRGNIIEKIEYDADNTLDDRYVYTYSSNNQLLTELDYDEDGLDGKTIYTYNKVGQIIKHIHYDGEGNFEYKFSHFTYDAQGNLIKQIKVDDDGDYHIYQRVYKYYSSD